MRNRPQMVKIKVGDLTISREYNRDIFPAWVRRLVESIGSPDDVPPLEVSARADGTKVILDGQHRCAAIIEKWGRDVEVWCKVHYELSVEDEARLFYSLNQRRKLRPYNEFHSRHVARDDVVVGIVKVLDNHGLSYGQAPSTNIVGAVASLEATDKLGPHVLDLTFGILIGSWGHDASAWDGHLISGVGLFVSHYPEADFGSMTKKLAKYRKGPRGVLGDASGAAQSLRMSVNRAVAFQLVHIYNSGRGDLSRLAPWA